MKKYSLDTEWQFHEGDIAAPRPTNHTKAYMAAKAGGALGAASPDYDREDWEYVDLPHDFAVAHEFDASCGPASGYKPRGRAWYSKRFTLDRSFIGKRLLIEFEGVSGECTVWLNGSVICRNFSGYNTFTADASDMAVYGDNVNDLVVYVNADITEGWWYEGAGIYRHVNLLAANPVHFTYNGVYYEPIKVDASTWRVFCHLTAENTGDVGGKYDIEIKLYDEEDNIVGKAHGTHEFDAHSRPAEIEMSFLTYSPKTWDVYEPNLYRITASLKRADGGEASDEVTQNLGFREMRLCGGGICLNDKIVPIRGVCCHQDHAGVGVAVPDEVHDYRIGILKNVGVTAYRSAHGMTPRAVLEACDKYGILVFDETRQFNTAETDGLKQMRDMVMRDRHYTCVAAYSIFNEEPLQGESRGKRLAAHLCRIADELDGTRFTVGAMNHSLFSPDGAADVCDILGINYQTELYDDIMREYRDRPKVWTESASAFMTRGCVKTDYDRHEICMYGGEFAPWGESIADCCLRGDTADASMGYFIWTGFDYRGEPTPFEYPSVSSQFGLTDTCGFPKAPYYLAESFWKKQPILRIVSPWEPAPDGKIDVIIYTNAPKVVLYINGREYAAAESDDRHTVIFHGVRFESGTICAKYESGSVCAADTVSSYGKLAKLLLEPSAQSCRSAVCVNVTAVDEKGKTVRNADNQIKFRVDGGRVLGVGNGDPNSHEPDKSDRRRLFCGMAQLTARADFGAEHMTVFAETENGISASVRIAVKPDGTIFIPSVKQRYLTRWRRTLNLSDSYPTQIGAISDADMNTWIVTNVGDGFDDVFGGKAGYAVYRTTAETDDGEKIVFCEITAETADIYINGTKVISRECKYGNRVECTPQDSGLTEITVVLRGGADTNAGITKPVVILGKG